MEAKDTVMERWRVNIFWRKIGAGCEIPSYADYGEEHPTYRLLQAQAEISFKAGRKSMLKDIEDGKKDIGDIIDSLCQEAIMATLKDGKQAMIKEVVEWVEEHTHNIEEWTGWQEQKEEWGIGEGQSDFTDDELKDLRHNACDDTIG